MFSALLAAAVVFSLLWAARRAPAGLQVQAVDQGVGVLAGCLVGGRLGYVLANWAYYQLHLVEALQFWQGGLSGIGAALGGALALLLVAALAKQRLTVLVDRMLPLLVVLNAAGWLGCWFEGCAYGLPAGSAWWGLPVRDDWGQVTRRFPLQPVGALLGLAIPWIVEMTLLRRGLRPGAHPGWLGALSLLGFALVSLALSFLRGDPTLLWYGLRPEAWGALGLMGTGAFMLIYIYLLEHRSQDKRKA